MSDIDVRGWNVGLFVPVVAEERGEALTAIAAGTSMLAVALLSPVRVRVDAVSLILQFVVLSAVLGLRFAFLLGVRAREERAYGSAAPVPDPEAVLPAPADQRRNLRRGRVWTAALMVGQIYVFGYGLKAPIIGMTLPLMVGLKLVHAREIARWQVRHGVVLWKPARWAPGHPEGFRASVFYSTPARP